MYFIIAFFTSLIMTIMNWFNISSGQDLAKIVLPCDQASGYTWACAIGDEEIATLQKTELKKAEQVFYFKPAQVTPDDASDPYPTVVTFTSTKGEKTEYVLDLQVAYQSRSLDIYAPDSFRSISYTVTAKNPVEGGRWSFSGGHQTHCEEWMAGPATVDGATRNFNFLWLTKTASDWSVAGEDFSSRLVALSYGLPDENQSETVFLAISIDKNGNMIPYDETKICKIELPYTLTSGYWSRGFMSSTTGNKYEPVQPENFSHMTSSTISLAGEYYNIDGMIYMMGVPNIPLRTGDMGCAFVPRTAGNTKVTFYDESPSSYPVDGVTPTRYITYVFTVDSNLHMTVTVDKTLTTANISK